MEIVILIIDIDIGDFLIIGISAMLSYLMVGMEWSQIISMKVEGRSEETWRW